MAASPFSPFDSQEPEAKAASPQRIPARIGKYEVDREAGVGDLVRVFLAYDRDIGRPVTLKLLTDVADTAVTQQFRREVAELAKLRAAGVAAIYELGEHVGLPFAAMQVPSGNDLRRVMQSANRTLLEKMQIMWQIGGALEAVHGAGIGHAGLRPSGIALDEEGHAILHDFGIVRLTPEEATERAAYASPEEWTGAAPDRLSDIFTLGAIYYELLAGVHPFPSRGGEPRPVADIMPECPEALERLVHRCLEKRRELRYQSVEEIQEDAEPILGELKRDRSEALVGEARSLLESRQLDAANAVLRESLLLDAENREAQRLRAEIRGVMRRESVRPRLSALLQEAEQLAGARRYIKALELLEGAGQLDSSDHAIRTRIEQVRALADQERRSLQLAAEARELLAQRKLPEAYAKATQALEADAGNTEIADLAHTIADAMERRKREVRIEEGIAKAKSLLLAEAFDGAISILLGLRAEAPESALVEQWLEHVRKQEAESLTRVLLEQKLRKAQSLVAQEKFNSAILMLGDLATEFPGERRIADLLDQACLAKDRSAAVMETTAECERLQRELQPEKALEALDATLARFPGETSLTALRQAIDEQLRERKASAAVFKALDESRWLMDQDRPDLAVQCLRNAGMEHPEESEIQTRLREIEAQLPDWENRRFVRETLRRVAALEELEQWSVALTVLEEALGTCPASGELLEAALRLRSHLQEQDRRKKLARRLEMIGKKIHAGAWSHALLLIDSAETEFPDAPELEAFRREVHEGSRRSESEAVVSTVRQLLEEGETAQAEEALLRGMEALGDDAALRALCDELETDKKHQEEWHTAQVLFGRRQFDEAERILVRLATQNHPDALLLLDKVREARAATEEDSFYKRGREKALRLAQQAQFEQAGDLLRNLLTLFPGDPILERDLHSVMEAGGAAAEGTARGHQEPATPAAMPGRPAPLAIVHPPPPAPETLPKPAEAAAVNPPAPPAETSPKPTTEVAMPWSTVPPPRPERPRPAPTAVPRELEFELELNMPSFKPRRIVLAGGAVLVLVLGILMIWKLSAGTVVARKPAAPVVAQQAAAPAPAPAQSSADRVAPPVRVAEPAKPARTTSKAAPPPRRTFDPSTLTKRAESSAPTAAVIPPPAAVSMGSVLPAMAAPVLGSPSAPPPQRPAAAPAVANPAAANPAGAPPPVVGGRFEPAKLLRGPVPAAPAMARQLGVRGTVALEITVDQRGAIKDVKVLSGHQMLASAAADAVRNWRYQPATLNGKTIESKVEIRMVFEDRK